MIELQRVTIDYGDPPNVVRALDSTSLAVEAGDSMAVVGRSGSGKSSLVSVIGLMRRPTTGTVLFGGTPVGQSARARRKARSSGIGMVFQSFHLEPHLTFIENCMTQWYCGTSSMSSRDAKKRARELAGVVEMADLADRRVADMSGGERQRVAIARALFCQPRLLVADEPTGNLDEETAATVAGLLWDLPSRAGTAVVVVTHDRQVAAGAKRLVHLERGRIVIGAGRAGA